MTPIHQRQFRFKWKNQWKLIPWNSKRVHKLFSPEENEHPKDVIACHIDILMDARTAPDGYKSIINGGDEHNNSTKRDIIKLNDKCIYFISALNTALNTFPKKNMERLLRGIQQNLQCSNNPIHWQNC
jgi:hypothetical protein